MERKTKIHAEDAQHDLIITREFDITVESLFKAHTDPDLIEQWMGSKAIRFEGKKHGSWQLEKRDENGVLLFGAAGDKSRLRMQIVYRSVALRDQMLKLPFAFGVNMAHDQLEQVMKSRI